MVDTALASYHTLGVIHPKRVGLSSKGVPLLKEPLLHKKRAPQRPIKAFVWSKLR